MPALAIIWYCFVGQIWPARQSLTPVRYRMGIATVCMNEYYSMYRTCLTLASVWTSQTNRPKGNAATLLKRLHSFTNQGRRIVYKRSPTLLFRKPIAYWSTKCIQDVAKNRGSSYSPVFLSRIATYSADVAMTWSRRPSRSTDAAHFQVGPVWSQASDLRCLNSSSRPSLTAKLSYKLTEPEINQTTRTCNAISRKLGWKRYNQRFDRVVTGLSVSCHTQRARSELLPHTFNDSSIRLSGLLAFWYRLPVSFICFPNLSRSKYTT